MHIRTSSRGGWSDIVGVALRIGDDVLELDRSGYFLNGEMPAVPPATFGDAYPFSRNGDRVTVRLSGGQFLRLTPRLIRVSAHGSDFYDSNGMCGKWNRTEFVGRDDVSTFESPEEFAKEWEVNADVGDPQLFRTPALTACGETPPPVEPTPALQDLAETACAAIPKEANKEECIFDVLTTGDTAFAENEIYTDPLEPEERCIAASTRCALRGGSCVWRCDSATSDCVLGLCDMSRELDIFGSSRRLTVVEGCSCAVPVENTVAETEMPEDDDDDDDDDGGGDDECNPFGFLSPFGGVLNVIACWLLSLVV